MDIEQGWVHFNGVVSDGGKIGDFFVLLELTFEIWEMLL